MNNFINYYLKKKFNFNESIDLSIIIENKKKNYFSSNIDLFYSINEKKFFLFLLTTDKKENNFFFGENYLKKFLKKEIIFDNFFVDKNNFFILNNYIELKNKFCKKKNFVDNYDIVINNLKKKSVKIIINKNNFLNLKIGNIKFSKDMIEKNYFFLINNLKKIFFKNNIIIKKIYISTTMSKSFLLK